MKTCQCCGYVNKSGEAPTCPYCGEASWSGKQAPAPAPAPASIPKKTKKTKKFSKKGD